MYSKRTDRKLIKYVREFKTNNPCTDCKNSYHYACMQFDHIGDKVATINRLMYRASLDTIKSEISKCELVCANCHAIRTYERQHGLYVKLEKK